MVGFGRTAKSVHQTKALRELFRMGMVSGVRVFEGSQIWAAWSIRFQQLHGIPTGSKPKLQNAKTRVGFGRTEKSVHQTKALRELFRMGMVSGILVFKGFATVGFFMNLWTVFVGSFFDGFSWSFWNAKIRKSRKSVLTIPKDAGGLGDLGKRVFGPKFPNFKRKTRIFVLGSDFC